MLYQHFLTFSDFSVSDKKDFLKILSTTDEELLIENLMQEVKIFVCEKYVIEYQKISKHIALFAVFALSSLRWPKKNNFFPSKTFSELKSFQLNPWCTTPSSYSSRLLISKCKIEIIGSVIGFFCLSGF